MDTWIPDWYDFRDARAELELAVAHSLEVGMTVPEVISIVAGVAGRPDETSD